MPVIRYSAIEMFGVPLGDLDFKAMESDPNAANTEVLRLLGSYSIEGVELGEMEATDITPPYWRKNQFRYFLELPDAERALIHLMPEREGAETVGFTRIGPLLATAVGLRTVEIPRLQPAMMIGGGSPRFEDICLHEFIVHQED